MPIYKFHCQEHGTFEELVSFGTSECQCPNCTQVASKEFTSEVALQTPSYFRADGSFGSSAKSSIRQGKYLKSEAHKENMIKAQKYEETQLKAEQSIANMRSDLEKDIDKRVKERDALRRQGMKI